MGLRSEIKTEFEKILEAHENESNPPKHVMTIKKILELENEDKSIGVG